MRPLNYAKHKNKFPGDVRNHNFPNYGEERRGEGKKLNMAAWAGVSPGVLQTTRWNLINPCFYPAELWVGDWKTPLSVLPLSHSVPRCPTVSNGQSAVLHFKSKISWWRKTTPDQAIPVPPSSAQQDWTLLLASVNCETERLRVWTTKNHNQPNQHWAALSSRYQTELQTLLYFQS